jgi:hypothetical protein
MHGSKTKIRTALSSLYGIRKYFDVFSAPIASKQHGFLAQPFHTVRVGSRNRVNMVVAYARKMLGLNEAAERGCSAIVAATHRNDRKVYYCHWYILQSCSLKTRGCVLLRQTEPSSGVAKYL